METSSKTQSRKDLLNIYLKETGKAAVDLSTLESLRQSWFELGYREGYRMGAQGEEFTNENIEKHYRQIRGKYD